MNKLMMNTLALMHGNEMNTLMMNTLAWGQEDDGNNMKIFMMNTLAWTH
jgi:hypothetical protein